MSHEEYWDYLQEILNGIEDRWHPCERLRSDIFKLTASPYHYWLENQRVFQRQKNEALLENRAVMGAAQPKPPPDGNSELPDGSPSTFAVTHRLPDGITFTDKASEIRSKARTAIKQYMQTHEKTMPSVASMDLWDLGRTYAQGKSIYKALDVIPDIELVNWNAKHGVFL